MQLLSNLLALALTVSTPATQVPTTLPIPVSIRDLRVLVDADDDAIAMTITYRITDVGEVTIRMFAGDIGVADVDLDGVSVARVELDSGIVTQSVDLSRQTPEQIEQLAVGAMHALYSHEVADKLAAAGGGGDSAGKCFLVGQIAGATMAVLFTAGCSVFVPLPGCTGAGYSVFGSTSHYISSKCKGAQNKG